MKFPIQEYPGAITETVTPPPKDNGAAGSQAGQTFTADDLQRMTFPPLSYLLPGLIPEGLCLLVSRPKLGKSWLVLDVAVATAAGKVRSRKHKAPEWRCIVSSAGGWKAAAAKAN
jgi:AAA domain